MPMYIALDQVQKAFGSRVVLNQVSISVQQGELIALLGPSGCGKTTLLNAVAGLLPIDGGSIHVADTLFAKAGYTLPAEQRNVGMVFQDFALWPHMTVYDNIAFGLKVQKLPHSQIQAKVRRVLERVQMSAFAAHYPHQLSGGQKQRIAIARALAPEPRVLLMDEPLSNLDAKLRVEMRWQLTELIRTTGITTLYVTHDQIEALTMADQIVLMNQGRVEQAGSPEALYHAPTTEFAASFIGSANLLPCMISAQQGDFVQVDVKGLRTYAAAPGWATVGGGSGMQSGAAAAGGGSASRSTVWMVRPSDIAVFDTCETVPAEGNELGTWLEAIVLRRAFQGDTWQYQVRIVGNCDVQLEVWDKRSFGVHQPMNLWIPASKARIVEGAERRSEAEMAG